MNPLSGPTTTTTTPFLGTWRCLSKKDAWPGCRDKRRGLSKEQCQAESIKGGFQGFGQVNGGDCCLKKFNPVDVPNNLKFDKNVEFCYWFIGDDPVAPDYRQGQVAGCSGCGGRTDECWNTCGRKAGFCSKCDSAQGSLGACCKAGHNRDPAECKNAEFSQGGYHECVLVNPLQQPTTTTTTAFPGTWRCLSKKDAWPGCRDKRRGLSKEQCQAESIAGGFQGFGQVRGADCCLKKFNPADVPNNLKFDGNVEFCYWFVGNDPVPPDYRQGQVAGCSGCGRRTDECWDTCGRKAGWCSKCNSAQGSGGACCKAGDNRDPIECRNAEFTQGGYHECVLVNPLQQPPAAIKCGNENQWCSCTGTVHYGKRYLSGKPGRGDERTFEQVKADGIISKAVNGRIRCRTRDMGGDPSPFYYKVCFCEAA